MKLAEALIERADLKKQIAGLRWRLEQNAKVQDGEKPAESIEELLPVFDGLSDELEKLVKRINRTNAATPFGAGALMDALAERDHLKSRIATYRSLYDAAAIKQDRYSRSEIRYVRCVDTAELQKRIDLLSKQYRKLDTEIQAANWATDLSD
jgi:chorismate mutase